MKIDKYDLLYKKYKKHINKLIPDCIASKNEFELRFATRLEEMNVIALNDSCLREGFLHYSLWKDEVTHCHIPVFGYYAENEKTMVKLFQKLAETIVMDGVYDFSVNIYSDDIECLTAFHMMQFGNMSEHRNEKLAGIIEWNTENCILVGNEKSSVNVGEVFVYPEFRGTGLSEKLLRFAESRAMAAGYKYMWVEHETANPNARGFWNKYFDTCQYELVRRIG